MKIYTKTGDKGTTSLLSGKRVSKGHQRIMAYGTTDELNAYIGLLRDQAELKEKEPLLLEIQDRIFTIGSHLANAGGKKIEGLPELSEADISKLEQDIDSMNEQLEPMRNFVLPGGHQLVSQVHIARCVCRRAEREVVVLAELEEIDEKITKYLNRLSDWLFVLSRYVSKQLNVPETPWKPR